jgi:hypothetical protein
MPLYLFIIFDAKRNAVLLFFNDNGNHFSPIIGNNRPFRRIQKEILD